MRSALATNYERREPDITGLISSMTSETRATLEEILKRLDNIEERLGRGGLTVRAVRPELINLPTPMEPSQTKVPMKSNTSQNELRTTQKQAQETEQYTYLQQLDDDYCGIFNDILNA